MNCQADYPQCLEKFVSILIESDGGFAEKPLKHEAFLRGLRIYSMFSVYIYIHMYVHILYTDIHIIYRYIGVIDLKFHPNKAMRCKILTPHLYLLSIRIMSTD